MAQRLNTLLADLTVRPTAAMTTRDQLDRIFRAEIERMSAHLDDIAFPARRTGGTDDAPEMDAERKAGEAWPAEQQRPSVVLLAIESELVAALPAPPA